MEGCGSCTLFLFCFRRFRFRPCFPWFISGREKCQKKPPPEITTVFSRNHPPPPRGAFLFRSTRGTPSLPFDLLVREIPSPARNRGSAPNWSYTFRNGSPRVRVQLVRRTDNSETTFEKWRQLCMMNHQLLEQRQQLCCRMRQIQGRNRFFDIKKFLCYNIYRKRKKRFAIHHSLCRLKQAVGWRRCGLPSCRALPFYASGQQRQVLATRFLLFA